MSILEAITKKTAYIKKELNLDFDFNFVEPKISLDELNIYKDQYGFELVGIPSLKDLPVDDAYFEKFYPKKNKFWNDDYKQSIYNDHKQYGGKILLYESLQKPNFLSEIQLYGSVKGDVKGLDRLEKEFLESMELLEAEGDLAKSLGSSKNRYSWSYDNIKNYVVPEIKKELKGSKLPGELIVRPATNFIDSVFFPYNGETETYEWTSTQLVGAKNLLTVGHEPLGGLSCILDHEPDTYYANIGVRFAVVL